MGGIVTELKMASDKLESDRVDKAKQVMDLHREVAQNVRRDRQAGRGGADRREWRRVRWEQIERLEEY